MSTHLTRMFSALGEPHRLAIVDQLLSDGEKSAGDIVARLPLSAPAVSRHLKVLCDAGILDRRVEKQRRIYSARPDMLATINRWTMDHEAFWAGSLDRLERALELGGENDE